MVLLPRNVSLFIALIAIEVKSSGTVNKDPRVVRIHGFHGKNNTNIWDVKSMTENPAGWSPRVARQRHSLGTFKTQLLVPARRHCRCYTNSNVVTSIETSTTPSIVFALGTSEDKAAKKQ